MTKARKLARKTRAAELDMEIMRARAFDAAGTRRGDRRKEGQ
jgi:hypothetical protein